MTRRDIVSQEKRSAMMRAVRQKDTPPELAVRRMLRSRGLSYRVRNRDLPGSPDIANRKRRWAVFVHGCFWHGHRNCAKTKGGSSGRIPSRNREFWLEKVKANRARDARAVEELQALGFQVLVVWECELADPGGVEARLAEVLSGVDGERGER